MKTENMLSKEDIPGYLRGPVDAATDWINSSLTTNFEVTGLADKRVPVDTTGVFELGIVLCDGEICERKQVTFEPTVGGFKFAMGNSAETDIPPLLDPPAGNRVGWLDDQLEKFDFVLLLYYRGLW